MFDFLLSAAAAEGEPSRPVMVLVIILALAVSFSVIAGVLAPRFQSQAIDHLVSRSFSEVSGVLALMILLYALHGAATLLQGYLSARLSQRIIGRLRGDLFHKIVNLPVSYLDSRSHGDIMSRMTNDAENVSTVISQSLSSLFSGILTLIGTIIVMLSFNVPLTLLTCSSVILSIWLTKIISELMHKYYVMRQTLLGQLTDVVITQNSGAGSIEGSSVTGSIENLIFAFFGKSNL